MLGIKIGVNQLLSARLGGDELWAWTPAQLLAGKAGFWLGQHAINEGRLFQDVAETTPVTAVGQFIGRARRRAGTVDAEQATALSRPAPGRWPKGAKPRNLVRGSSLASSNMWTATRTESGLTATRTAVTDTSVSYTLSGVSAGGSTTFNNFSASLVPVLNLGEVFSVGIECRIVEGIEKFAGVPNAGVRVSATFRNEAGASTGFFPSPVQLSTSFVRLTGQTAPATSSDAVASYFVQLYAPAGFDATGIVVELRNPQVERGAVATPYQPTDADGVPLAGYGQVRNLAMGAQAIDNPTYWPKSATAGGVAVTQTVNGIDPEDGLPFVEVRFVGTPTGGSITSFNSYALSRVTATLGQVFSAQCVFKMVAGSTAGIRGMKVEVVEEGEGNLYLGGSNSANSTSAEWTKMSVTRTFSYNEVKGARYAVSLTTESPYVPVDVTFRIKGLQFERGETTALQLNYGPNNVTEQGVEEVHFLFNDGNDALLANLPAGTYGIAFVNPAGGITYTAQTLSSAGNIDALRGLRTVDAVIRQGDFTAEERGYLERYWGSIAA